MDRIRAERILGACRREYGEPGNHHQPVQTGERPEGNRAAPLAAAAQLSEMSALRGERRLCGRADHPARQNLRVCRWTLHGEDVVFPIFALRVLQRAQHRVQRRACADVHHEGDVPRLLDFVDRVPALFHRLQRRPADRRRFHPEPRPLPGRPPRVPMETAAAERSFAPAARVLGRSIVAWPLSVLVRVRRATGRLGSKPPATILGLAGYPTRPSALSPTATDGNAAAAQHDYADRAAGSDGRIRVGSGAPQQPDERGASGRHLPSAPPPASHRRRRTSA